MLVNFYNEYLPEHFHKAYDAVLQVLPAAQVVLGRSLRRRGHRIVILPRGDLEYCIIGLVEVLWEVFIVKIDQHLVESIYFHDILHGSRARS